MTPIPTILIQISILPIVLVLSWFFQRSAMFSALKKHSAWQSKNDKKKETE